MHSAYQIVIPTRDSSKWVGSFLKAYRNLGIEPLYLIDTRSKDGTAHILHSMQAHVAFVTPAFNRVESILCELPQYVEQDWAVRFDDDEMPSKALVEWLDENITSFERPVVAMSRRDCLLKEDQLFYSRLEAYYFLKDHPHYLDPQWRAFRHREVVYRDVIHTPGFELDAHHQLAPQEAYFIHLDWVLRTFEERLAKLKSYERQTKGGGQKFAHFYLPELHHPRDLRLTELDTDEFDQLALSVAVSNQNQLPVSARDAASFHDLDWTMDY